MIATDIRTHSRKKEIIKILNTRRLIMLLLRDRPSTESSSNVLTKTEIDFIVRYLATT